jgi:methylene-fatty-acyl-phospholipid synthase
VTIALLLGAAAILGLERAAYVWIARAPGRFRALCARPAMARLGEPVAVVRTLFYVFKVLQSLIFLAWWYVHSDGALGLSESDLAICAGMLLGGVGQMLNVGVFYRLGAAGVFYGDRLGHPVPWCREFPFTVCPHPQYVGSVLTIWGVFLIIRFPHPDWSALPVLETVYYAVSTYLEERQPKWIGRVATVDLNATPSSLSEPAWSGRVGGSARAPSTEP